MSISEYADAAGAGQPGGAQPDEQHPDLTAAYLAGRYDGRKDVERTFEARAAALETRATAIEARLDLLHKLWHSTSTLVGRQNEQWGELGASLADMHNLLYEIIDDAEEVDLPRPE